MPHLPVSRLVFPAAVGRLLTFAAELGSRATADDTQPRETVCPRVLGRHVEILLVGRRFGIKVVLKRQLGAQNNKTVRDVRTAAGGVAAQEDEYHAMNGFFRRVLLQ